MIHTIGNSHLRMFSDNKQFELHTLGAATAHNLNKLKSTTDSNRKLFDIINNINREHDSVILVLGEIDCSMKKKYEIYI